MIVHIAVVEHASAEGREPEVFIGHDHVSAARGAISYVQGFYTDELSKIVAHADVDVNELDPSEIDEWLADLHEATTVPWISFYERELAGDAS